MTETRVFRLQNEEWSIWNVDGDGAVMGELAELALGHVIEPPIDFGPHQFQEAQLKAVQRR